MYSDDQGYGYSGQDNYYYYGGGYGNGGQGYEQYNQQPPQQQPQNYAGAPGGGRPQQQQQGQYGGDGAYFNPAGMLPPGMNPVLQNMAKQYGETLMGQGKEMVDEKLQKFVSVSKLKYYFAVDTGYVMKKMGLLFFPFTHKV